MSSNFKPRLIVMGFVFLAIVATIILIMDKCDGECQKAKDMESALDDTWRWLEDLAKGIVYKRIDDDEVSELLRARAGMIKRALGY